MARASLPGRQTQLLANVQNVGAPRHILHQQRPRNWGVSVAFSSRRLQRQGLQCLYRHGCKPTWPTQVGYGIDPRSWALQRSLVISAGVRLSAGAI